MIFYDSMEIYAAFYEAIIKMTVKAQFYSMMQKNIT